MQLLIREVQCVPYNYVGDIGTTICDVYPRQPMLIEFDGT
jgi:hypothetical protein